MNNKLLIVLLLILIVSQAIIDEQVIDFYSDIISKVYDNGLRYRFPKNAFEHCATEKPKKYGSYDFVIIGAGAGGSVSANRLTEVPYWNVLLLEAGQYGNILTDIPDMFYPIQFTHYNWAYNSTPQKTACLGLVNRVCLYPRGKGVGGSSLINGLVYARGHKSDFDKWAKAAGNERWGYNKVLEYFKKSEHFVHRDPDAPYEPKFHGHGGYLNVEYHLYRSPHLNVFLDAHKEIGLDIVDYNANRLGASPSQLNTFHGTRLHNAKAFLYPINKRSNLNILTGSYVTRIILDTNVNPPVAVGVEFSHNGHNYYVEAKKEVILAAGVFGSPQILMLSGIGPRKHLQDVGIKVVKDLEVGTTLRDNPTFFGLSFSTNYTEPIRPLKDYVKQFLNGIGPLTVPASNQGIGFYESSYTRGTGVPDIELMLIPANSSNILSQRSFGLTDQTYEDVWKYVNATQTFTVYVVDLHSQSIGSVKLKSKNPYEYPLINSNFLSDPQNRDINTLYEGIQLVLKMSQTKAFRSIDAKLQPGFLRACKQYRHFSRDYWYCALRQLTINLYHPLGTCPMGTNPKKGAVVNYELKVFGIENLRVADASVFPFTLAGHPNTPTVMVGEQLADLIKFTHKGSSGLWDYFL
ncbi:glucose dehydrogenase [FAD, quinone]-like [Zophobas morio]|uniref:glucose dehydrogenase [FAD, quinone]-like n=1 Tax=Zophobas morio TaxID=2755281 RepID=UPI003083DA89